MTAREVLLRLYRVGAYKDILIPEFTWGGRRIDALVVNVHKRMVRGYEIKVSRADFLQDKKWKSYAEFCNLLYMVCPEGLIQPEEIESPYGLIWVHDKEYYDYTYKKKAKTLNSVATPEWTETYLKILEYELPRIHFASTCVKCGTDVVIKKGYEDDEEIANSTLTTKAV